MDFKQLRALVTVADTGNVTRAATLLNIVQPAVSRQLHLLEADVGVKLFERSRGGMELTEEGRTLLECARRVLRDVEHTREEMRPSLGSIGGIVTVGLLPSTCDLLASALINAVHEEFPGIRIRLSMGYAGHLSQWLDSGEIDVALTYDPNRSLTGPSHPLLEEGLWVVGLPKTGLSLATPIALRDLASAPLILPSSPHGLRVLMDHASVAASLHLNIVAETNAMSVQKTLVLGGHGLTILPAIAVADDLTRGTLVAAPLVEPDIVRKIILSLPATRPSSRPVQIVANKLEECMRAAVRAGHWPTAKWIGA